MVNPQRSNFFKKGKLYKDIFKEVKRSTTIVDEYGLAHIHKR